MTAKKPARIPVALDDDQHAKLKAAAGAIGLSISQYMRAAALEKANQTPMRRAFLTKMDDG